MIDGCIHPFRDIDDQYGRVPFALLGQVSSSAAGLYGLLQRYLTASGYARVGLARLASDFGVQRQTVSRWLQELEGAGWLVVERRPHGVNRYLFAANAAISACVAETEHKVSGAACVAETEHKAACVAGTEHKVDGENSSACVRKGDHLENNHHLTRVRETDEALSEVVEELVEGWGVSPRNAWSAARCRPLDEVRLAIVGCTRAIDREGRQVRDAGAFVVKAIREGWYVDAEGEKARAHAERQAARTAARLAARLDEREADERQAAVASETAALAARFEADMATGAQEAFGAHVEGIEGWRSALVVPGWRDWLAGRGALHQGLLAEWSEWRESNQTEA